MEDCTICCEPYNKVKRVKVTCPTCDVSCCRACIQRYMLDTQSDPHCMSCRTAWNREFVDSACTKAFRMKQLKEHRENILFTRQVSLLPQTQGAVESYRECKDLESEMKRMEEEIERLAHTRRRAEVAWRHHNSVWRGYAQGETQQRREFVRRCPCDGCKGFLSTAWKCGVCSKHICKECNEEKVDGEEHVCKPENVETVKLLNKDTKGCPKCGTLIFKISGCSQMWCPDCHTAFNWNTMAIETGVIHNPHFFEFQRRQETADTAGGGRNLADIPCGGVPTTREVYRLCRRNGGLILDRDAQTIMNIVRVVHHVEHVEIVQNQRGHDKNWVEERVRYMLNGLSEDDFKKLLQRHEKSLEKNRDVVEIMRMVVNVLSDLLRQLVVDSRNYGEYMLEMDRVRVYANDAFKRVGERYNNRATYVTDVWDIIKI